MGIAFYIELAVQLLVSGFGEVTSPGVRWRRRNSNAVMIGANARRCEVPPAGGSLLSMTAGSLGAAKTAVARAGIMVFVDTAPVGLYAPEPFRVITTNGRKGASGRTPAAEAERPPSVQ